MPDCGGSDVLRFFMAEHSLSQSDLPEVGSQGVVSEILNGKRDPERQADPHFVKTLRGLTLGIRVGSSERAEVMMQKVR